MGYLILEKFNWRVPVDNISYGFKAYELAEGTQRGEDSARFLMNIDDSNGGNAIWEFFMLMTNYWYFTSVDTFWADLAYQIGGGAGGTGQEWYDRIQAGSTQRARTQEF